jgi:hypothetical protein
VKNPLNKMPLPLFRLLGRLVKKVNDQVLLLAFGLSLIVAIIAISTQDFPTWAGITLVLIFLIATIYFLLIRVTIIFSQKRRKITGRSHRTHRNIKGSGN